MGNLMALTAAAGLILLLSILTFRRGRGYRPPDRGKLSIQALTELVKDEFHEILTSNTAALYLNEIETKKKENLKSQLRKALRTCSFGDIRAKEYVKEHIKEILLEKGGIGEDTIGLSFPFGTGLLSAQDKFEILLHLYKKEWKYDALGKLLEAIHGKRLDSEDCLSVTQGDIGILYDRESERLGFADKLDILAQRIYQIYKGHGAADEIRDMNIDGISAGVSGLSDTFYDAHFFTNRKAVEEMPKSCDSIWIFYKGKTIHLSFLGFGSKNELERVCKNIYRYDNPGQLSAARGYIANEMQDGSRVIVVRPPFCESWAFFVRKFDSAGNLEIGELITGKGREKALLTLRALVEGCQVIGITGEQGCGKTTLLKALICFINPSYTLRIQELIFELNLRKLYPDRNILTFKETASVSGQEGLDLQKKTDGTVTILGEVATAPVASWLVQVSQTASRFTMFTHHAKTTGKLIGSLRNALLLAGGFSNEQVAEEQAADAVNFDIHMVKDRYGKRYIERITEIISERSADGKMYAAREILVWENGEYKIKNPVSARAKQEILSYLPNEMSADYQELFEGISGPERKEEGAKNCCTDVLIF